ncbi:unnamed protein product [Lactuca saligna]|uniref:RST domain-containing protein n=1 Tax=Lactuca saligna TaxID=75948 RepID=A0AA35USI6_LACSI|nr:unnamed protein product [Lactuca saligna]
MHRILKKNPVNSQEPNITRNPENESQLQRMNRMGNQQQQQAMSATGQAANAMNRPSGKQVPFALLFPVIEPQLDKDRAMQLQGLYVRLRNNNINKEEFIRHMRSLVDASKQDRDQQPFPPLQGPFKQQQQQHMQFPQPPFPNYGNPRGNFHPGSSPNMNMTSQSFKPQSHDLQMRQGPVHHQVGGIGNPMSQNAFNDMKRMHGGNLSHLAHSQSSMHKDHMLMSGKQFKILNRKLNSLLQLQADARGRNMFSGIEVDVMLKAQEHRLQNKLDQMNKCNKLRVKAQSDSFNGELKELKAVAKERHALFVQDVKNSS